jgi:SAM-dependent methyltransferase
MLLRLLASIGRPARRAPDPLRVPLDPAKRSVLNVGGGSKGIALPPHYAGWAHLMLDIDPAADPDVLLDARELARLDRGLFDAVYCSHNLEHYYAHDVPKVLAGFARVLKPEGFAEIRVPDVGAVAREIARGREMEDVLYTSPAGAVSIRDVLYGFGRAIEKTGTEFYAHKTGFTRRSLADALTVAGFSHLVALPPLAAFEIRAIAMRVVPDQSLRHMLRVEDTPDPL